MFDSDDELLGNAESGHQTLNSVTSNIQSVARPVVPFPPSIGGWRPSYKSSESLICEPVLTEAEKHRADSSGKVSRAVGIDAAPVSSSSTSEVLFYNLAMKSVESLRLYFSLKLFNTLIT